MAGQGCSVNLRGWAGSDPGRVWVAALACQGSALTKGNFLCEALDRGFIVPALQGTLSPVTSPASEPTPVEGQQ